MMQIKIFTMPFNSQLGIFDDGQFNDFSKDKELVSVNALVFCHMVRYNGDANFLGVRPLKIH